MKITRRNLSVISVSLSLAIIILITGCSNKEAINISSSKFDMVDFLKKDNENAIMRLRDMVSFYEAFFATNPSDSCVKTNFSNVMDSYLNIEPLLLEINGFKKTNYRKPSSELLIKTYKSALTLLNVNNSDIDSTLTEINRYKDSNKSLWILLFEKNVLNYGQKFLVDNLKTTRKCN